MADDSLHKYHLNIVGQLRLAARMLYVESHVLFAGVHCVHWCHSRWELLPARF